MIIIGRMVRITITKIIHTQEIIEAEIIEALATTEAETAHTREDLRTDLGTTREVTRDLQGTDEATLNHPETEIKDLTPEDVIGDIETKDLTLEKEEASIEAGETVETVIRDQEIADLQTETMKEMEGMRGDTRQDLHRLHHIEIGSQKSLL